MPVELRLSAQRRINRLVLQRLQILLQAVLQGLRIVRVVDDAHVRNPVAQGGQQLLGVAHFGGDDQVVTLLAHYALVRQLLAAAEVVHGQAADVQGDSGCGAEPDAVAVLNFLHQLGFGHKRGVAHQHVAALRKRKGL